MEWIDIETKKDVDALLERVEQFHDWYVAGFSYDPLARAEGGDLNLGRFKIDRGFPDCDLQMGLQEQRWRMAGSPA